MIFSLLYKISCHVKREKHYLQCRRPTTQKCLFNRKKSRENIRNSIFLRFSKTLFKKLLFLNYIVQISENKYYNADHLKELVQGMALPMTFIISSGSKRLKAENGHWG
jgi:hypothetical protein